MYSVGLDVDTLVSTMLVTTYEEIVLYAGKFLTIDPILNSFSFQKGTTLFMLTRKQAKKQSAGNPYSSTVGLEDQVRISDHYFPKFNSDLFGWYLAGQIEGDGHINERKLEIIQHEKDRSLAHRLKKIIGYGQIYNIKDKKAIKYVISKQEGRDRIQEQCNGKFVGPFKIYQIIKHKRLWIKNDMIQQPPTNNIDQTKPWLSGFQDADGTQGIFVTKSKTHRLKVSTRQEIKISQKEDKLLNLIKNRMEGYIYKDDKQIFRWTQTGKQKCKNLIEYIDKHPLLSLKFTQYHIQRKAFRIMQRKEHLTEEGQKKIKNMKTRLSKVYK